MVVWFFVAGTVVERGELFRFELEAIAGNGGL
jgi:hypothetical protein